MAIPEYPLTRVEQYLDEIAKNGGGGGGSLEIIHAMASNPVVDGNTTTYTLTIEETGTEILAMETPIVLVTVPSDVASVTYQLSTGLKMVYEGEGTTWDFGFSLSGSEFICEIAILPNGTIDSQFALIITEAQA